MSTKEALRNINNAVLDLQSSDYNTYQRPLERLASGLRAESIRSIVEELREAVDLEAFLNEQESGSGMLGSQRLQWPAESALELGLIIRIIEKGAEDPDWFLHLAHRYYYSGSKITGDLRKITAAMIIPFSRDFGNYVMDRKPTIGPMAAPSDFERVFIVHGHDEAPRETVARFIASIGFEPVILHEQANRGMTIPEKLAAASEVGFAVVLLTPDDVGRAKSEEELQPRARQNVILELGYFVAKLGRDRVCALLKDKVEIPSDYMGVLWTDFDAAGAWKQSLARELNEAGYEVDWNKVMR